LKVNEEKLLNQPNLAGKIGKDTGLGYARSNREAALDVLLYTKEIRRIASALSDGIARGHRGQRGDLDM
jgi:hypothetical protein